MTKDETDGSYQSWLNHPRVLMLWKGKALTAPRPRATLTQDIQTRLSCIDLEVAFYTKMEEERLFILNNKQANWHQYVPTHSNAGFPFRRVCAAGVSGFVDVTPYDAMQSFPSPRLTQAVVVYK